MQTENLKSFFVWYVITCHLKLTERHAITFALFLNIPAHFLMKIDRNIISSLLTVFSLCAQVGWCDVCTNFTNVIKVDVDENEMSPLNILKHAQHSRNN